MKPLLLSVAAGIYACTLAVPAFADDAKDALLRSQQAQLAAPKCRMTVNSKEADSGKTSVMLIETVNPGMMHVRQEQNGKVTMEMFTDGKKTMIRRGPNGPIMEAPETVGAMITSMGKSSFLQGMEDSTKDVKIVGHEVIDGQAATIYTFTTETTGIHANSKLWISEKDSLPLKGESDSTGSINRRGTGTSEKTNRHAEVTFSYDPSITFALPLAG